MKKLANILLAGVIGLSVVSGAACAPKQAPVDANTLKVYCVDLGYGVNWVEPLLNAFKNEDWVKEKYPNLKIATPTYNDVTNFAQNQLDAGEGANDYSILFGTYLDAYSGKNSAGYQDLADLTETVYNASVPGENIKYKDKIYDSFLSYLGYKPKGETEVSYYVTPWAGGMDSIVYNQDLLDQMNKQMPVTTDELVDLCEYVKEYGYRAYDYAQTGVTIKTSFLQGNDALGYMNYLFKAWWAQYEGIDGYYNFWNGIDSDVYSKDIFTQQGRLLAAQKLEEISNKGNGYVNEDSFTLSFMDSQIQVLEGRGLFCTNGDWFDSEMAEMKKLILADGVPDYRIKIMPTPILSDIIDNLDDGSITSDEELALVVRAIDRGVRNAGATGTSISEDDFAKILEARSIVETIGPAHTAAIPNYSLGKDVAIDFLRYMATDEAQNIYMLATGGANLPFKYDVEQKSAATFNQLTYFHKDRLKYFASFENGITALPMQNNFPLVKYANLTAFSDNSSLFVTFSERNNTKHALDFYNETIADWTDAKWNQALNAAGLL